MAQQKIARGILSLILLTIALHANATATKGDRSCGKWVKGREDAQSNTDISWIVERQNETWLLGFLTGLSIASNQNFHKDFLQNLDNDSIFLWIDNYCKASPLKNLSEAGIGLMFELIKK